jgi:hypothetical protein
MVFFIVELRSSFPPFFSVFSRKIAGYTTFFYPHQRINKGLPKLLTWLFLTFFHLPYFSLFKKYETLFRFFYHLAARQEAGPIRRRTGADGCQHFGPSL